MNADTAMDNASNLQEQLDALRESEEMYRSFIERSNDGVVVLQDTLVKLVNPRFEQMSGYPAETLLETPFINYLTPEEIALLLDRYQRRMAGEPISPMYETTMTRSDGSKIHLEVSAAIASYKGRPADLVLVRDITERKRTQEILARERDRLDAALEALERALEEARRESWRASALEGIAEAGLSILRLPELLHNLVEQVAHALSVDASCVFVLDEEAREFEAHAAFNVPGLVGCRIKMSEGLIGKVADEGRPIYIGDAEHDPLAVDSCRIRTVAKTLLGVPLVARGKIVGVVRVQSLVHREFTEDEVRLMQAIADRVAVAIDNAKLYEALQSSRTELEEALEREKHFSLLLQQALLPAKPSAIEGYSVAMRYVPSFAGREIGGDFYDVFGAGGWTGILIGDVSGKGLEAASLAATTRSTVHAFVHETRSPGEALTRANPVLYSQQPSIESFVTVAVATLDPATGDICYASAGHPPAAVLRADGEVALLPLGDIPLGITECLEYAEHEDRLAPGDTLVLYTDGISEAHVGSSLFNFEGIERTLRGHTDWSVERIADELVAAATAWAEGRLKDDAAVVVVRRG